MTHGGDVWQGGAPEDWLDFSANLRPEGMPEWVKEALCRAVNSAAYYPDIALRSAREGIAAYAGVEEKHILPTAGGISAIDLALRLESGCVRTQMPDFSEYMLRAKAQGRTTAETINSCQRDDTVFLSNPNNPTGSLMRKNEVLSLYDRLRASGAALVVDEAFIEFCPSESVRREVVPKLRVVGSLTKILCIPGVRLGYVCADENEINVLEKQALPWEINAFAAQVAKELPLHREEIARDAAENTLRRERFEKALTSLGASVSPSAANFILCDFGRDMTGTADWLRKQHILVRRCESFGLGKNILRLNVRTDEENQRLTEEIKRCPEF